MSIAICMKINDGIVLAADSATTLMGKLPTGQMVVANTYNNANKIFNLRKGLPIGLVTWGSGGIGTTSISTLVKDLRLWITGRSSDHQEYKINEESYTLKEIAILVRKFMYEECYLPAYRDWLDKPAIGFMVAGYSSHADMGDEYFIEIVNGQCAEPRLLHDRLQAGATWGGIGEPLIRLFLGYGSALPQVLQQRSGLPPQTLAALMETAQQAMNVPMIVPAMPLQDAIDLAEFMVDLTIKWVRFAPGPPLVAGPIELAAISKHEGFRWIKRKLYFSKELNPDLKEEDRWKPKTEA